MQEQPTEEDIKKWQRRFAVEANNRAWELSEKTGLTAEEETELLFAAYAAAHHWSQIGTAEQIAQAQLLLGRVHALLGHGGLAMQFASAAYDAIVSRDSAPWELAFAHAVLANAAATAGDAQLHEEHYRKAQSLGNNLAEPLDEEIFYATFDRIPAPRS